MQDVDLVLPSAQLEPAYRRMIADWGDEPRVPFTLGYLAEDFAALLARLEHERTSPDLAEGFVNHTAYWLVDPGGDIVAVASLRHALTKGLRRIGGHIGYGVPPSQRRRGYATEVLARVLVPARELGIERALVTCSKDNHASRKTILRNGGKPFEEEQLEPEGMTLQRFWVPTS